MNVAQALIAFTFAAGLATMTPGMDTALVLRTAAVEGTRRAMLAGLGIGLGVLTWGLIASVGLGALLAASQFAYNILRIVGAAYLLYIGGQMLWRAYRGDGYAAEAALDVSSRRSPFLRGYLTNLLNPKVGVFYVTFLPQFIPAHVNVTAFSMLLAAIHAGEGVLWFATLSLATRSLSRWLARPNVKRGLDAATGTVLVGFGGALLARR